MKKMIPSAIVLACIFLAFCPLFFAGYLLNFDDNTHVYQNEFILNGHLSAVWKIFASHNTANDTYIPLTVLTFLYEQVLVGLKPVVSHTINIALHCLVCVLAWSLALRLGMSRTASYIAVLLFAVHPMHVEPVAWVTARKDLLYSIFYLSAMISYWSYLESRTGRDYIVGLAAAGLSILAKPMALSLPLMLWLLDAMKGRRFSWALLWDKIPFFLAVEPVALVTYVMNARQTSFLWPESFFVWFWSVMFYLKKFFCPSGLALLYIFPPEARSWSVVAAWSAATGLVSWALLNLSKSTKFFFFAAGFYAISLFFIWRYDLYDLNVVADRFMYLPSLGLCYLLGIAAARYWEHFFAKVFFAFILSGFVVVSFQRSRDWQNPFALWHSSAMTQPTAFSFDAQGESLFVDEYYAASRETFMRYVARRSKTSVTRMRQVFGKSFEKKIEAARRVTFLRSSLQAIQRDPYNPELYQNQGLSYVSFHQYDKALGCFSSIIRSVFPPSAGAFFNRGVAYQMMGKTDLAMKDYNQAIRCNASYFYAYINRARLWLDKKEPMRALADALMAVKLAPTYAPAYDVSIMIANGFGDQQLADRLRKVQRLFLSSGKH